LAKRKADAKKNLEVSLVLGRDIELKIATGTDVTRLQLHRINEVANTLWLPDTLSEDQKMDRAKSATAMLEGIRPQGEIEGLLAAQMVATHSAAMECLRRAMPEGQTLISRDQNLKHAAKLLSIYARQVEVLDKHRGKGQQKVTVEYVNVEPGGQAIVGHVETGKGPKRRKGPATPAINHAPEVPLEIPDPVTPQKTRQKMRQKTRRGR
jgi:hypothetical protein